MCLYQLDYGGKPRDHLATGEYVLSYSESGGQSGIRTRTVNVLNVVHLPVVLLAHESGVGHRSRTGRENHTKIPFIPRELRRHEMVVSVGIEPTTY